MKDRLLLSLVAGIGCFVGSVHAETVPFYIIIGQSNTGWTSSVTGLTPANAALYQGLISQTQMWNPAIGSFDAVWGPLNVGYNTCCEDSFIRDAMGPEASLLKSLQTQNPTNRRVFKHGKAGSSLGRVPNGDGWAPPAPGLPAGFRWVQFTTWLSSAADQANAQGDKLDLKGIIWMQGEEDALDDVNSAAYLTNLTGFFAAIDDFWNTKIVAYGFPDNPYKLALGRVLLNRPYSDRIRQAQQTFCASPANNAVLIDTDNYERIDSLHYSANGQVQFGLDIFNAAQFEQDPSTHQAYSGNTSAGNQAWRGELGLEFAVNNPAGIVIAQLGAFDDQGDGIHGTQGPGQDGIRVAIFNKSTQTIVPGLDVILSGTADPLVGRHRLKDIRPVLLGPGNYVVVAKGYNVNELMNNSTISPSGLLSSVDGSGGALTFVESSYGNDDPSGFAFPTFPFSASPNAWSAGTFAYRLAGPASTYSQWQRNHFSAAERLNASIGGPNADPDQDGLSNLMEYYFSCDPWSSNANAGLPMVERTAGFLSLIYQKDTRITDVAVAVETSTNLLDWDTAGVADSIVVDGTVQTRRASVDGSGGRRFLRLKLTK